MKPKNLLFVLFLACLLAFCSETAEACSCLRRDICQSFAAAQVVLVGKVLDSTETVRTVKRRVLPMGGDWEENEYQEKRQISRVAVVESFVGMNDSKEILIETEISSSCGFYLQKDTTYLIFANQVAGEENLMTHFCSGTGEIAPDDSNEILDYLRTNKNAKANVSGKIGFGDWTKPDAARLAKYGVTTVSLTNQENQFQTTIEPDGSYKFPDVPAGKYKIRVVLPDFLTFADEYHPDIAEELEIGDQSEIEVFAQGCYKKDFVIQENGRISGRITDAKGEPIEDITVQLIPLSKTGQPIKQEEPCYDMNLCISTDENGSYFFKGLKAGRYLVGVRLSDYVCNDEVDAGYQKAYFPGVADSKKAVPVTVKFGKPTADIDFKLTRKYIEREIKGRVFFKDGRPAPNVRVRYVARTPDYKQNGLTFIKTDADGYFSLTGYENHSYLIGAFTDERDGNEDLKSFPVIIDVLPKKPLKEMKIVLDQSGDAECEKCGKYFDFLDFPKLRPRKK